MGYQIEFQSDAKRELNIALCYFDAIGLREKFMLDFTHQMELIEDNPFMFQKRYSHIRILNLSKFSYSIHYTVKNNVVYIFNVLSQSQRY